MFACNRERLTPHVSEQAPVFPEAPLLHLRKHQVPSTKCQLPGINWRIEGIRYKLSRIDGLFLWVLDEKRFCIPAFANISVIDFSGAIGAIPANILQIQNIVIPKDSTF